MARAPTEIRSLARQHTEAAIRTLAEIMGNQDVNEAARISAANSLLDRGWGKATQPISGDEENPLNVLHTIERVIVKANQDG